MNTKKRIKVSAHYGDGTAMLLCYVCNDGVSLWSTRANLRKAEEKACLMEGDFFDSVDGYGVNVYTSNSSNNICARID